MCDVEGVGCDGRGGDGWSGDPYRKLVCVDDVGDGVLGVGWGVVGEGGVGVGGAGGESCVGVIVGGSEVVSVVVLV